jgi:hypothetical protein
MSTWVQQSKSMRAGVSKSGVKNETPKLPETIESLGKIGIFLLLKSDFPHTKFNFLQQLSAFFNGFPLSSMAFRFLQWLSDFPQRLSTFQEIWENQYTAASIRKITIWALYFPPLAPRAS